MALPRRMASRSGRATAMRVAERPDEAIWSDRLHVAERSGDLPQLFGERRKFRCARIALAPGESDFSRKACPRRPRISNGVPLRYCEGGHKCAALACGDHVFQRLQAGREA